MPKIVASPVAGLSLALALALAGSTAAWAAQAGAAPLNNAGEVAGHAVHEVCLGLFDGQANEAARLAASASAQGMTASGTAWVLASDPGTTVSVEWMAATRVCQVTVTGPAGSGLDLLAAMDGIGWTPVQHDAQTSPDMAADIWTGQPQGVDAPLYVVANKWTSDAEPTGGRRLVLTVVRAQ